MAKRKHGFYWHVHHEELMEYCYDYDERVDYICHRKPAHEVEPRLRLMHPVRGKLPEALIKARAAYDKGWAAYDKAQAAWDKARAAWENALREHKPEIEALHAQECPNCPWDGETIFPQEDTP